MLLPPYLFKSKAVRALKGNWQTALLVSFVASLPFTLVQLLQVRLPDWTSLTTLEAAAAAVNAVPTSTWYMLYGASLLNVLLLPVLSVGCDRYFLCRVRGEELGFGGLFSRFSSYGKCLWLYVNMYVRVLLWSLLLFVPGVIAAMRYAMAPYYLAENPELTAREALEKSKETMNGLKMSFFVLELSFIGWSIASMIVQLLLYDVNVILALVVSQFVSLFIAAYMNGACAAFYHVVSAQGGVGSAQAEFNDWMRRNAQGGAWRGRDEDDDTHGDPDGQ
ncbi:MAG: DUF975 family protein [Eubacteriales bacterium]|nr:DUF975 family protein [Eubacteriales bacterium]